MKFILTIVFISTYLISISQTDMFWNNYSNFNPAMSGFEHSQHGSITGREVWYGSTGLDQLNANYNQRFKGHHGVGINYSGSYYIYMVNLASINYNYQFDLKTGGRLSAGVSAGAGRNQYRKEYIPYPDPIFAPRNYLYMNIGAAYSWKNLMIGASTTNLFPTEDPSLSIYPGYRLGMNAHASYDFKLGEKFNLTPRMLFTTFDGFHTVRFNMTAMFKNKLMLGLSVQNRSSAGMNFGFNLKEKLHFAYSYSQTFSKLNNTISSGNHEFTIGYFLK